MISQPVVGGSDGLNVVILPKRVVRWTVEDIYSWSGVSLKWAIDKVKLYVVGKFGAECGWGISVSVIWKDRCTAGGEGLTNLGLEDEGTSPSAMEAKHFHDDIPVEVEIRGGNSVGGVQVHR